jgi:hypothetical protein
MLTDRFHQEEHQPPRYLKDRAPELKGKEDYRHVQNHPAAASFRSRGPFPLVITDDCLREIAIVSPSGAPGTRSLQNS